MPAGIRAEGGTVSVSDADAQNGRKSLRWQYEPGGKLIIPTGPLGDIDLRAGYGQKWGSALEFHIRTIDAPGELRCSMMAGPARGGSFTIPLIFDGWQRIAYHLTVDSKLEGRDSATLAATDHLLFEAPAEGPGGTIYLDWVSFNAPCNLSKANGPVTTRWQPVDPHRVEALRDVLSPPPTSDELAALKLFWERDKALYPGRPATDARIEQLAAKLHDDYQLQRLPDGTVSGIGLAENWQPLTRIMKQVAVTWLHTDMPAHKARLEELYFMASDFMIQQGAKPQGSLWGLNWYRGRELSDSNYIMRAPLRRTGRLSAVVDYMMYNWDYHDIFETGYAGTNMDFLYINLRYHFMISLMLDSPQECVMHLRAFSHRFSQQIIDTVKPDGSLYHHGFHYFAYASGASTEVARQMQVLAPTPFRVTPEAYEAIKRAFMAMRWYANVQDLPLSLHGRHPMAPTGPHQRLRPAAFTMLADAGRPYHGGRLDPEVAAAALRLDPNLAKRPPYAGTSIRPETPPAGHRTMPFAALTSHRRDDWLALVRGYGKYFPAQESYDAANRHGLFFGNGFLSIMASGDPIGLVASGCNPSAGWDWRMLDGCTTIRLPYAQMANGFGTMMERSDSTFVGGLTHAGRNGLFAMPLHSVYQYRKSLPDGVTPTAEAAFSATKSYFFFDDRIICLGSDIALPDSPYPVQTALFQKYLTDNDLPGIRVNGAEETAIPYSQALPDDSPSLLVDTQGCGYYLPAGQQVQVERRQQVSRDGHDKADTSGHYAVAWIKHGTQPTDAGYEYAILVGTTAAELATFADAMAHAETPPYTVVSKSARAHVVRDAATQTWGAILFQAQELPAWTVGEATFAVSSVDRPCLIMQEDVAADRIALSLADPDLAIDRENSDQENHGQSTAHPLTVTLRGRWACAELPPTMTMSTTPAGDTTIVLTCHNGASTTIILESAD